MLIFVFSTEMIKNPYFYKNYIIFKKYLFMGFFKAFLPSCNLLPSQVDVNIQQHVTKHSTGIKFTLG